VIAVYAVLAAWSGARSPLARGPLLDGLGPVNYRWVSPPPELASTNQRPTSGRFRLRLDDGGVGTEVVFTSDSQVTVIVDEGSIGPVPEEPAVELLVEPVDPAELSPPGGELAAFGNAYRVSASYGSSGDRIRDFRQPMTVIMVYPATSTLHATTHEILYSPDGRGWEPLETTDSPGQQQAEAALPAPGYVVVAGEPALPSPSASPSGASGPSGIAVALLVGAGVMLVLGIGLLIRSRAA
jgi:hypothetical protein